MTAAGSAAIAAVRLCGDAVDEFLSAHVRGAGSLPRRGGRAVHARLVEGDVVIDDPLLLFDPAGQWVELCVHGGPWVVSRTLDLARRFGFDVIDRIDLPLPAEAIDASDELDPEVFASLPLARTELAVRVLLAQQEAWRGIDLATMHIDERTAMLQDRSLHWLLHPPRVAIVGEPNVGKSTIANQLFGQERSIVADLPGTTRDWVGEIANLDGLAVMLVDTPGLRQTTDPIEREAIEHAGEQIRRADLVMQVLTPASASPRRDDAEIVVMNKIDLQLPEFRRSDEDRTIDTVATTGEGMNALRSAIRRFFGCENIEINRPRAWTDRQRAAIEVV